MDYMAPIVEVARAHPYALIPLFLAMYCPVFLLEAIKFIASKFYWQGQVFSYMAQMTEMIKGCLEGMKNLSLSQENIAKSQERLAVAMEHMGETFLGMAKITESILSKIDFKIEDATDSHTSESIRKNQ